MFQELNVSTAQHYSKIMDNQHIVMVGDSLMRYQYLSLLYLIQFNKFYTADTEPNILREKDLNNWEAFYQASNSMFSPNEYCDCYRVDGARIFNENRYYYNKERNISVSYIQYLGEPHELHGHWMPADNETNHQFHAPYHEFVPFRWAFDTLQETLFDHIAKLRPKPSVLVLNAGFWPNLWQVDGHRQSVLSLGKFLFDRVIWKTSSFDWARRGTPSSQDTACHFPGVECLNLEWTRHLPQDNYYDIFHLNAEVNIDINIQFLLQLAKKSPTAAYTPMDLEFYDKIVSHKGQQFLVDEEGLLRPFADPPAGSVCMKKLSELTRISLPTAKLVKHLLGPRVLDICTMVA